MNPVSITRWGRVAHICVSKLTTVGSDNGLSPGRRQAIIWTNARILLIGPLGTSGSGILIGIQTFSFRKMHLKISSAKWRPFCLDLNVLIDILTMYATSPRTAGWLGIFRSHGTGIRSQTRNTWQSQLKSLERRVDAELSANLAYILW